MATKSTYRRTQFPDDISNRADLEVAKAFDDVAERVDVLQSPAVIYSSSGVVIATGDSVIVWSGSSAGSASLFLPLSQALGKGTAAVLIVCNLTTAALTLQTSGAETINGASSFSVGAESMSILTSDGAGHWAASGVGPNSITNQMLAQMPAQTIKGNNTGATANAADLTGTQVTAMLNVFTALLRGLVPASGGGSVNFLRADGSWVAPPTSAGAVDVQIFTANGTWTAPSGARIVHAYLLGGGGGGGGGRRDAAGTTRGGGGGGGGSGGRCFFGDPQGFAVSGAATVTVGAGGTAGTAATADGTSGGTGGTGGTTTISSPGSLTLNALGGVGGAGGTTAAGAGGSGGANVGGPGATGGAGGVGAGAGAGGSPAVTAIQPARQEFAWSIGAPGGGGGGGITAGNATEAGAQGGTNVVQDAGGVGAVNANGGAGTARNPGINATGGAGGGGSSGTNKTGGSGGNYGGGAGGGGASVNGTNSGAGGVGGAGAAIVVTICG